MPTAQNGTAATSNDVTVGASGATLTANTYALGANTTNALVISQVVLSIALPLPMIALIIFSGRRDIMGAFANSRVTQIAATVGAGIVIVLNLFLIAQLIGVPIPGLAGPP